jgi:hypothetical protein
MSKDVVSRLGGLLALAIGAGVFWLFIWQPLDLAQLGVPEIRYSLKAFTIVPLCLVFGLAFLFMGSRLEYRTAKRDNLTPLGWVLFVIAAVFTAAGFWWFSSQFAALGYQ